MLAKIDHSVVDHYMYQEQPVEVIIYMLYLKELYLLSFFYNIISCGFVFGSNNIMLKF